MGRQGRDLMTTLSADPREFGADALIMCDNLVRIYQVEDIEVQALQGLDLLVSKGEMIAIVGQSGSGKSTLLNVLSGLDVPTAGSARVAGWDLLRMSHKDRLTYRRSVVGFVWQQTGRNLVPYLSARENVMLPMAFAGVGARTRSKRARELLEAMGLGDKASRRPYHMSGGEQQRVAIAVALANNPEVVFADEPTGELDSATGKDVFEALRSANRDLGATVVVVTHDHAVSSEVQRTVAIRDGRTSTEVLRREHVHADGTTQTLHEEYALLDRAGRMQLPKDYREALGLGDRVRLVLEPDHLGVWNDKTPRPTPPPVGPVEAAPVEAAPVAAEETVPVVADAVADAVVAAPPGPPVASSAPEPGPVAPPAAPSAPASVPAYTEGPSRPAMPSRRDLRMAAPLGATPAPPAPPAHAAPPAPPAYAAPPAPSVGDEPEPPRMPWLPVGGFDD